MQIVLLEDVKTLGGETVVNALIRAVPDGGNDTAHRGLIGLFIGHGSGHG